MSDQELVLTDDDLIVLNACLNELCNGVHIEEWEFQTRIGSTRMEVRALLDRIHACLPSDW